MTSNTTGSGVFRVQPGELNFSVGSEFAQPTDSFTLLLKQRLSCFCAESIGGDGSVRSGLQSAHRNGCPSSHLSERTLKNYSSRIGAFLNFWRSNCTTVGVHEAANRYLNHLKSHDFSPYTLNGFLTALEHFCDVAEVERPAIKRSNTREKVARYLTHQERRRLLDSMKTLDSNRQKAIVLILYYCGLRSSEIVNLKLSDWSRTANHLLVRGRRDRTVPLREIVRTALSDYLLSEGISLNHAPDQPLFKTLEGKRISKCAVDWTVKRVGWSAHLDLSPQLLRNTFVRNLLESGVAVPVVIKLSDSTRIDPFLHGLGYSCDPETAIDLME